jgi:8-oxo-dGTP pyrophosphatase MutT (NUDIX family)
MEKSPWIIQHQKQVYDNPWINVTEYAVLNPSGNPGIYGKVHFKNTAVGILAMDNENNIFLVGQFRFATDSYSWEIPEGGEPVSSDPLEGAKRELAEETGLHASNWQVLLTMHLSNSVSDERAIVYLATGLTQHLSAPEETEQLVVKKLPLEEAFQMVENGTITDSMSVAAILKIKLLFAEGKGI